MKKRSILPFLAVLVLFTFQNCGSEAPKTDSPTAGDGQTSAVPRPAAPVASALFLQGIYATSEAANAPAAALFDQNDATGWLTQAGSGPDEGLMLQFTNPVFVQSVDCALAGDAAKISVYADGKPLADSKVGKAVSSLFFRLEGKTDLQPTRQQKDEFGQVYDVFSFSKSGSAGISRLAVIGENGQKLNLAPPKMIDGTASASSVLEPRSAYGEQNLFDSKKEFVWVEGSKSSSGEGESILFRFEEDVKISKIRVWNGFQRSANHFSANARAREFEFSQPGGLSKKYTLRDDAAAQDIDLKQIFAGKEFKMTVSTIFKGQKYKDLALAELLFFDEKGQPFKMRSKNAIAQSVEAGSPLEKIVGRHFLNRSGAKTDDQIERSIILRPDGTFVCYEKATYAPSAAKNDVIADGNWEPKDGGKKVRLFGNWRNVAEAENYYRNVEKVDFQKIFQDVLTIGDGKIDGGKFVGPFYF